MMNYIAKILIFFSFFSVISCQKNDARNWSSIKETIRKKFPEVKHISVDELDKMLAKNEDLFLIDNRNSDEFAISHIKNAHSSKADTFKLPENKNAKIIVYCSVGYRSSAFVKELQEKGYTNAYNLEGSIFEWANKSYPLYQAEKKAKYVHPYDKKWGQLLNKEYHPEKY